MDKRERKLEQLATEFRRNNGLNATEAIRLKSLLLKNNILTVFLPLSGDLSGMAVKTKGNEIAKCFILVNANHTLGRQHFTICHELYHLYYQKNFTSEKSLAGKFDKKGDPEEYNADIFASHLLLPEDGVYQMIPEKEWGKNKISLQTILKIEHYYSCSRSALLNRLIKMGLIDQNRYQEFNSDKIKNAILHGYNEDLYKPGNEGQIIGNYGILAKELYDKGMISENSYFSLLEDIGIDLSEFDNKEDYE
ncbi:ImmA/IrrE family metallo-endopeptidase [Prolixibacteraceae bacterium]|nr:ImmA/IrrE family metallo-endopeptidase [Prolixibacteraceae bacterium]